jgi:hypothetical protein
MPFTTTPVTRQLTVVLGRYGGIYERGSREYTLDDFHSLQLDKLDRYVCLKESGVTILEGEESSSDDDEEDEDEDDRGGSDVEDDGVYEQKEQEHPEEHAPEAEEHAEKVIIPTSPHRPLLILLAV